MEKAQVKDNVRTFLTEMELLYTEYKMVSDDCVCEFGGYKGGASVHLHMISPLSQGNAVCSELINWLLFTRKEY